METDTQRIVKLFSKKLNVKFNGGQFKKQLGIAKNLLKKYSLEEITLCINYLSLFPPKSRIVSLGYLPYIMKETLTKATYYYTNLTNHYEVTENTEEVKNEQIETKSIFNKNRRF